MESDRRNPRGPIDLGVGCGVGVLWGGVTKMYRFDFRPNANCTPGKKNGSKAPDRSGGKSLLTQNGS